MTEEQERMLPKSQVHTENRSLFLTPLGVALAVLLVVTCGCAPATPAPLPHDEAPRTSAPAANPYAGTEYIERSFEWTYWRFDDMTWEWSVRIPTALYKDYSSRPRPATADYTLYAIDDGDQEIIEDLATTLAAYAASLDLDELETIHFIAAFAQHIEYGYDIDTKGFDDYGRYPVETLVDQHGDCEDTSILLAKILHTLGYDVVMVLLPDHMALGVREAEKFIGTYYEHNGLKYYYLETTGLAGRIGMVPEEYEEQPAYIYDFSPRPIITHDWTGQRTNSTFEIQVTVENHGLVTVEECSVLVGFDAGGDHLWHTAESPTFTLSPGDPVQVALSLPVPHTHDTRLLVYIVQDGTAIASSTSQWFYE